MSQMLGMHLILTTSKTMTNFVQFATKKQRDKLKILDRTTMYQFIVNNSFDSEYMSIQLLKVVYVMVKLRPKDLNF